MDWSTAAYLDDMTAALPESASDYGRRWRRARVAALRHAKHLKSCRPDGVGPDDLRLLFVVLELYLFKARYRTAFEDWGRVEIAWRVVSEPDTPDCFLELYGDQPVSDQGVGEVFFVLCVSPARALQTVGEGPAVSALGERAPDLLDALLSALLRLMLLAAAVVACGRVSRACNAMVGLLKRLRFEPPSVTA